MTTEDESKHVRVGGEVSGQVVVGDQNIVITADRSTVTVHNGTPPTPRRRERPVGEALPRPGMPLIGRDDEVARISAWLEEGVPIQVHGPPGVGKSALLRRIVTDRADAGLDVVHLSAAGLDAEDVVQELFQSCYDIADYRPEPARLRRLMGSIRALIVVDDFDGQAADVRTLLDATPSSDLLIASAAPNIGGQGRSLELGGLPEEAALRLIEAELGRELEEPEAEAARRLCAAAHGHPRALVQAVAALRDAGESSVIADPAALTRALAASLSTSARRTLRLLRALDGLPASADMVAALTEADDGQAALAELHEAGLAEPAGAGYSLSATFDPAGEGDRPDAPQSAAEYARPLARWARSATPQQIARAAPVVLGVLAAAVTHGDHEPARTLARVAAPAFARTLRWGSWRITLGLGSRAAGALGSAEDLAYFEHEEGVRKRALGVVTVAAAGVAAGGAALGGAALAGHGLWASGGKTAAIAIGATVVVGGAIVGVAMANNGGHDPKPAAAPAYQAPSVNVPTESRHARSRVPQPPARLILSPSRVTWGASFRALATGFRPGETVRFTSADAHGGWGWQLGTDTADPAGHAEVSSHLGSFDRDAPVGRYQVLATGDRSRRTARAALRIDAPRDYDLGDQNTGAGRDQNNDQNTNGGEQQERPALRLEPHQAGPGGTVFAIMNGFRPYETVRLDGLPDGVSGETTTVEANSRGEATMRLRVGKGTTPGQYSVSAIGSRSGATDPSPLEITSS